MSTRAIITIKDASGKNTRRLYAHGDGYPSQVGMLVYNFARKIAPAIDANANSKVVKAAFGSLEKPGRYDKWSPLGRAYALMHNVSIEPDKFVPALITYMTSKGYGGLYLTNRNPEKEASERKSGHGGTDIVWHYIVTLGKTFGSQAKVDAYYREEYGPKVEGWRDSNNNITYIGSKEHFVKQAPIPQLVAEEREEQEAARRKYEEDEKARKEAEAKIDSDNPLLDQLAPSGTDSFAQHESKAVARVKKARASRAGTSGLKRIG